MATRLPGNDRQNNAKYFLILNGWLYFTKERFDLLYPSYGDTYPTYNGAIGMTFEQGGISAGLSVKTEDGSILTLVDRALKHHYTTGISTIEVSSADASKLVTEFKNILTIHATLLAVIIKPMYLPAKMQTNCRLLPIS